MNLSRVCMLIALLLAVVPPLGAQSAAAPAVSLEQRLERVERRLGSLADIMVRLDRLQQEIRQLRGEVEVQAHAMEGLEKRQRDLYLDIDQRLGQLGSGGPEGAAMPGPSGSAAGPPVASVAPQAGVAEAAGASAAGVSTDPVREEKDYQQAFGLLKQGRYAASIAAFQAFLDKYPAGNYADNAQYWLGEGNYVARNFEAALSEFGKVLERYPYSEKIPGAMLKIGYIYYEQKKWSRARDILTKLEQQYPTATESRLARQRLERMRGEGH